MTTKKILLLTVIVLLFVGAVMFLGGHHEEVPPEKLHGRLVVVAVFDQMSGDYLERWKDLYDIDGFQRMKEYGVWYSQAYLPYASSITGPGHASIATGKPPKEHGIVENEWWEYQGGLAKRGELKSVYCASGERRYERVPRNPDAGKRSKSAEGGMSPERLLASTMGDVLHKASGGKGRVFSLAVKDRAAVLMGGKEPNACYCFDNATGEFNTSEFYRDTLHPWVDQFNKSHRVDKWFNDKEEWNRLDQPIIYETHAGPDDQIGEYDGEKHADPKQRVFPHALRGTEDKPGKAYWSNLERSPFGNEMLWDLAENAIDAEHLGGGEGADLLYLGFSCNDLIGHAYGPDSQEVLDVTLRSDRLIGKMIKFLDSRVGPNKYSLIITADHGICPLPERSVKDHPEACRFSQDEEFGGLNAALAEKFGKDETWVEKLQYPWVFLNEKAAKSKSVALADVEEASVKRIESRAVVQKAYSRTALSGPPSADPILKAAQLSYFPDRCGDVLIVAKPFTLPTGKLSVGTTHGSPHDYDRHVPILAFGRGIPGLKQRKERVSSLLVAPIVCRALGIEPPSDLYEKLPGEWAE